MAEFTIQAGGKINVATRDEVRKEIQEAQTSWFTEIAKGDRYRRFSAPLVSLPSGDLDTDSVGPEQGFVWSVTRLALTDYDPTTEDLALYVGNTDKSSTVLPKLGTYQDFTGNQLVLYPGEHLVIGGSVTGSKRLWMTGQARELPITLAWRL